MAKKTKSSKAVKKEAKVAKKAAKKAEKSNTRLIGRISHLMRRFLPRGPNA
jgi:hypothetical protein